MFNIALYQPDIPQNTASIIRLCSCFSTTLEIIEPCGFHLDDKRLKKVAMDYLNKSKIIVYKSYNMTHNNMSFPGRTTTNNNNNSYTLLEAVFIPNPLVPIGALSRISCGLRTTFMRLETLRRCHPRTCSAALHTIELVLLLSLAKPTYS